jgi:hypothetical protein
MVDVQVAYCDDFKYPGKQEADIKDEFNDIMWVWKHQQKFHFEQIQEIIFRNDIDGKSHFMTFLLMFTRIE